jgi:radical SAM superfamily enzyme YgiQ (UPF0313 family)
MDEKIIDLVLDGRLFSDYDDRNILTNLTDQLVRPAAPESSFGSRLRAVIDFNNELIAWAETVFERCLQTKRFPVDLPISLQGVFQDLDGTRLYEFLDTLNDAILRRADCEEQDRVELIASAHFGRAPLTIARRDQTRVVLINLTKTDAPLQTGLEALGVETLAGHVLGCFGAAISVHVFDAQLDDLESILGWTLDRNPHIVGLSVNIGSITTAQRVVEALTGAGKSPLLVFGGRGAEFYPDFLSVPPGSAAFVVPGWGELSLQDIIAYHRGTKPLREIRNISRYRSSPDGPWEVTDWSDLQSADLTQAAPAKRVNLARYAAYGANTIETVRGCSYSACLFCPRPRASDRTLEYPSKMKWRELAYLSSQEIASVPIIDEEFWEGSAGIRGKIPFLMGIVERKQRGWIRSEMSFCADMRADTICAAKGLESALPSQQWPLRLLRQAGVKFIFVGLESLSQPMLDHLNKGTTVEQNVRAVQILRAEGFKFQGGSLGIAPLMELEWLGESMKRIRELNLAELADPSLTLILFGCSPYFRRYFGRDTEKSRKNRQLLDLGSDEELPHLDALSGVPYRFKDERVAVVAEVHGFHDREMFGVMKRLRAINAQLIYMGEEDSPIYREIWKWLSYGRMEVILWGMEQLYEIVSQPGWRSTVRLKKDRVFAEMKNRKERLTRGLSASIQKFQQRSELTPKQAALVLPDHLF